MSFNEFIQWLRNLFSNNKQPDVVPPTRPVEETPSTPEVTPPVTTTTPAEAPSTDAPETSPPVVEVEPPSPPTPTVITAVSTESDKAPLNSDVVFQITTKPTGQYADCTLDLSDTRGTTLISDIDSNGHFTIRFNKVSSSDNDIQTIRVRNPNSSIDKVVTVSLMKLFWSNHPGRKNVCDETLFTNQCAIRMSTALELSGIKLPEDRRILRRCTSEYRAYKHHKEGQVKGHVLAAQELANWIKSQPSTFGQRSVVHSQDEILGRSGIIFFRDGWGTTDHIDVWDGEALVGGFPSYFDSSFKDLWFWDVY